MQATAGTAPTPAAASPRNPRPSPASVPRNPPQTNKDGTTIKPGGPKPDRGSSEGEMGKDQEPAKTRHIVHPAEDQRSCQGQAVGSDESLMSLECRRKRLRGGGTAGVW